MGFALAWLVSPLAAEDGPPRFHDVRSWRGSFVASAKTLDEKQGLGYESINPWKNSASYNGVFSVDFILDEFEDEPAAGLVPARFRMVDFLEQGVEVAVQME